MKKSELKSDRKTGEKEGREQINQINVKCDRIEFKLLKSALNYEKATEGESETTERKEKKKRQLKIVIDYKSLIVRDRKNSVLNKL